jgi:hypothetical protein
VLAEVEVTRKEMQAAANWVAEKQQQERAFVEKIENAKRELLSSNR